MNIKACCFESLWIRRTTWHHPCWWLLQEESQTLCSSRNIYPAEHIRRYHWDTFLQHKRTHPLGQRSQHRWNLGHCDSGMTACLCGYHRYKPWFWGSWWRISLWTDHNSIFMGHYIITHYYIKWENIETLVIPTHCTLRSSSQWEGFLLQHTCVRTMTERHTCSSHCSHSCRCHTCSSLGGKSNTVKCLNIKMLWLINQWTTVLYLLVDIWVDLRVTWSKDAIRVWQQGAPFLSIFFWNNKKKQSENKYGLCIKSSDKGSFFCQLIMEGKCI